MITSPPDSQGAFSSHADHRTFRFSASADYFEAVDDYAFINYKLKPITLMRATRGNCLR
jgi:hypothetical protein